MNFSIKEKLHALDWGEVENSLASEGYAALNVRDIARDAGVNHALINYHFSSKDQLLTLALGANLNNTIAIGENKIMNRDGLRHPEEFVRHKMLDAVGDLALAGRPLLAAYRSVRGGHRLNSLVLKALFADTEAWTIVQSPRVRERAPVDIGFAVAAGE